MSNSQLNYCCNVGYCFHYCRRWCWYWSWHLATSKQTDIKIICVKLVYLRPRMLYTHVISVTVGKCATLLTLEKVRWSFWCVFCLHFFRERIYVRFMYTLVNICKNLTLTLVNMILYRLLSDHISYLDYWQKILFLVHLL